MTVDLPTDPNAGGENCAFTAAFRHLVNVRITSPEEVAVIQDPGANVVYVKKLLSQGRLACAYLCTRSLR